MEHLSLKQLNLYPLETKFFIKLKNFETGAVKILKDISLSEYEKKYIKYCKYLNAQGYNVFLSPMSPGGVHILMDDISKETVELLFSSGFEPFYALETSPSNFQAVIKLSDTELDKNIQKFISRRLAEFYNADLNSTDPGHFHRLSGFTNRKSKYCKNGLYPFVKLMPGFGLASKGKEYINQILKGIESGYIELPINTTPKEQGEKKATANAGCYAYIKKIYESNQNTDLSGVDFKACRYAVLKGFDLNDIKEAVRRLSPDIENRKRGHIDDYLNRTIKNAALPKK